MAHMAGMPLTWLHCSPVKDLLLVARLPLPANIPKAAHSITMTEQNTLCSLWPGRVEEIWLFSMEPGLQNDSAAAATLQQGPGVDPGYQFFTGFCAPDESHPMKANEKGPNSREAALPQQVHAAYN